MWVTFFRRLHFTRTQLFPKKTAETSMNEKADQISLSKEYASGGIDTTSNSAIHISNADDSMKKDLIKRDEENKEDVGLSFTFEGCSWGCIFYVGIWHALKEQLTPKQLSNARFGGSSSGTSK